LCANRMDAIVHHIAISVLDLEKEIAFYRDVLGFKVEWDMDNRGSEELCKVVGLQDANPHIVMLSGYGLRLELFKYHSPIVAKSEPKRQCDFGITHFALSLKDINEVYDQLLNAGVDFNCPPQDLRPGVCATYMKDPEGNTIELIEYR
jgi:glyoxylase I family protein